MCMLLIFNYLFNVLLDMAQVRAVDIASTSLIPKAGEQTSGKVVAATRQKPRALHILALQITKTEAAVIFRLHQNHIDRFKREVIRRDRALGFSEPLVESGLKGDAVKTVARIFKDRFFKHKRDIAVRAR